MGDFGVWRGRSGRAATGGFQARAAAVFVAAAAALLPTAGIAIGASPAPASALDASPVTVATAAITSGVQVDAAVRREMEALRIPGLALAIVRDGAVVYEQGYGVADPTGRAVTPSTPFILGSTSKALTGLVVAGLVDSGQVDLDAPAARYIPELQAAPQWATVRVRDLLGHVSGLSTRAGLANWSLDGGPDDTLAANATRLAGTPFDRQPGTTFEYSNANYDLLGRLIESVTGDTYAHVIAQRVFEPLGMVRSYADRDSALSAGLATGYYQWFGLTAQPFDVPYPRGALSSSMLISSADDLAHVLIAELEGGRYLGRPALPADAMALSQTQMSRVDDRTGYAFGWFMEPAWPLLEPGVDPASTTLPTMLDHGGDATVYHSTLTLIPSQHLGLAMVMNSNDEFIPSRWGYVSDDVLRVLVGTDLLTPTVSEDALRANGQLLYLVFMMLLPLLVVGGLAVIIRRRPWWHSRGAIVVVIVLSMLCLVLSWLGLVVAPAMSDGPFDVALRREPDVLVSTAVVLAAVLAWVVGLLVLSISGARRARVERVARTPSGIG